MSELIAFPQAAASAASKRGVTKNMIARSATSYQGSQMGREPTWRA